MKILHLKDDPHEAKLVWASLRDKWADCDLRLATNQAEFIAALREGPYDAVVSDLSLLQFDGTETLCAIRELAGTTPFVFFAEEARPESTSELDDPAADQQGDAARTRQLVQAIETARRQTREAAPSLRAALEANPLVATLQSMPDLVALFSPDGRVLHLNVSGHALLGLPLNTIPQDFSIKRLHPPQVWSRLVNENIPHAAQAGMWSGESLLLAADNRIVPISQVIIAHRGPHGEIRHFSTVLHDLRPRKQGEALVHGQKQVLEMIAGGEPVNETLSTLLNFVESQCPDMFCSILLVAEDGAHLRQCVAPRIPAELAAAVDGMPIDPSAGFCGAAAHRRATVLVEDIASDPLWVGYRQLALAHGFRACWSTPIFDVGLHLLGTFAVYFKQPGRPEERHRQLVDIGIHIAAICLSRNQAEAQLRSQADILNKASDAIVVADSTDRISFWNSGAARTFGWTAVEAVGRSVRDLFPPRPATEGERCDLPPADNQEWRGEAQLKDCQGAVHIMDTRITPIRDEAGQPQGRLAIATDVTAKRRIEEQFFRAQRLESIGMLAAGIAHDLNNVLAPILLAAPMLRDHVSDPGDLRMIATLEKSAERGAALVRQILNFAQGADGELRVIQPKHLLRDVATFIQETFPKSIRLEESVPAQLWSVKANPTQLHQVLLNLCVNARDAMPHGGTLTLRGENCVLDEIAAAEIAGSTPGAFMVFHVQDTGGGIPPELLERIWEPFFTTKGLGKGTGLGLSTVRGIVESHGGFSSVQSALGQGTTFRIYLQAAETAGVQSGPSTSAPFAPRGTGELVLVADDEPGIRNMAAVMLARHGYRVLTAADGAEAIALFAPRCKEIPLVITDLSMPNLDGAALASVVQRLNPRVKIIAVSGHSAEHDNLPPACPFTDAFLIKPFRAEVLLTTVHQLLRSPSAPPA